MKKRLDYIYNEPPRVLVMLGINLEAFQCLTAQVEKAHWGLNWRLQVLPASLYEEFGHNTELWSLIQEILLTEVLLTDSTEQSRERPQDQKTQKGWFSGKKHTQKTQILGTSDGLEIVDVIAEVKGPTADINLFRELPLIVDARI